jgi:uncharacterized protein (TIGR00369 family)
METLRYAVVPIEEVLRRSGCEFLEAMRCGELPLPPLYQTLGFRLKQVERGRVVIGATPDPRVYSPVGSVHAGFTSALLEAAATSAVQTALSAGELATPVEFKVNLVRALYESTGPIDAIAMVLYRGRTVATAESRVIDSAGKLYAHATATCAITTPGEKSSDQGAG